MQSSKLFFQTLREAPADAELTSHNLMLRASLIKKLGSGIYSWLPLGLKVLRKIENLIRFELNQIEAQEVLLPIMHPANLWQETGRWEKYGDLLFKIADRNKREFCLGATHEEVITDLIRKSVHSYKQFPLCLYQIQTKFRDEIRPRFGVMRSREFLMKDAYSFHLSEACLANTYQHMFNAYSAILAKLELNYKAVLADNGDMGGNRSHEFQVIANAGEDQIVYSNKHNYAANIELATAKSSFTASEAEDLTVARGIEVGHIFELGTRYTDSMQTKITSHTGIKVPIFMGCYGIGISRLMAACIEQKNDENGIIWPNLIAPFKVVIIPINFHQSNQVKTFALALYEKLCNYPEFKYEVLLEDRDERPGVIFKDYELLGIPHRIVITEQLIAQGNLEYKARTSQDVKIIPQKDVLKFIN